MKVLFRSGPTAVPYCLHFGQPKSLLHLQPILVETGFSDYGLHFCLEMTLLWLAGVCLPSRKETSGWVLGPIH